MLGLSRGGEAAWKAAIEMVRRGLQITDVRFAAHIAISPGGCMAQVEDARATGAPIFFMLAELDLLPIAQCFEFFERMWAAGNQNVRLAIHPGVFHSFEWTERTFSAGPSQGQRWASPLRMTAAPPPAAES